MSDASGNTTNTRANTNTTDASGNATKVDASGNATTDKDVKTIDTSIIFNEYNLDLITWILAIFLVLYFGLGIFTNPNETSFNRTVDTAIFIGIITLCVYVYYNLSKYDRSHITMWLLKEFKHELNDPKTTLYMVIILGLCYVFMLLFNIPFNLHAMPKLLHLIIAKTVIYLVILLFVMFFIYVLKINIVDNIYETIGKWWNDLSNTKPASYTDDDNKNKTTQSTQSKQPKHLTYPTEQEKDEVFNISNNLYTYDDAPHVCSALGARLATYDEIEDAYNKGADWCNYGWSDNQMAFFPTQKTTWQKLQKNPKIKNNCGRPGVNGGYMGNPKIKFGVNCFGKKPNATESDLDLMNSRTNQITPKTQSEIETERKVNFWKENADKLLNINPHNEKKWSEY